MRYSGSAHNLAFRVGWIRGWPHPPRRALTHPGRRDTTVPTPRQPLAPSLEPQLLPLLPVSVHPPDVCPTNCGSSAGMASVSVGTATTTKKRMRQPSGVFRPKALRGTPSAPTATATGTALAGPDRDDGGNEVGLSQPTTGRRRN